MWRLLVQDLKIGMIFVWMWGQLQASQLATLQPLFHAGNAIDCLVEQIL